MRALKWLGLVVVVYVVLGVAHYLGPEITIFLTAIASLITVVVLGAKKACTINRK